MTYDPDARRDTPLARKLKERIRREGPLSVAAYMSACLHDPEHGYYVKQPAIGRDGDFITAPEISQVFGELIGLWSAVVWQQMGSPARVNLVELGPGRGTLMRDALRAARKMPGFLEAMDLVLIETNVTLRADQQCALTPLNVAPSWKGGLGEVVANEGGGYDYRLAIRELPSIIVGNEFLDTRPIDQLLRRDGLWFKRTVALDSADRLIFAALPQPARGGHAVRSREPLEGDVAERAPGVGDITVPLSLLARRNPVAALFVDYGHTEAGYGDTLQAVRAHRAEHPLTSPGEADLTVHVDFAVFAAEAQTAALAVDGPITQGEFLGRLGIVERASHLMSANPAKAGEIELAVARLIAPQGMGSRFKVIGVRSPNLPKLPGFE